MFQLWFEKFLNKKIEIYYESNAFIIYGGAGNANKIANVNKKY